MLQHVCQLCAPGVIGTICSALLGQVSTHIWVAEGTVLVSGHRRASRPRTAATGFHLIP